VIQVRGRSRDGAFIHIEIEDNGMGMTQERLAQVRAALRHDAPGQAKAVTVWSMSTNASSFTTASVWLGDRQRVRRRHDGVADDSAAVRWAGFDRLSRRKF
jgi:hypothetical protein